MDLAVEPSGTASGPLAPHPAAITAGPPAGAHVFRASEQDGTPGEIEGPWHDDLLGGAWSWPADDDEDTRRTMAEFETLLGELVDQLVG